MPPKKIAPAPLETEYVDRARFSEALHDRMGHPAGFSGSQSGYRASFGYARVEVPCKFSGTFQGRTEGLGDKSTMTTYTVVMDDNWFDNLISKVVEILSTGRTVECGKGIGMSQWRFNPHFTTAHVPWDSLLESIRSPRKGERPWLMQPDYQRGLCWTKDQQERFIGHILGGGAAPLIFLQRYESDKNAPPGTEYWDLPLEVIDGQQRLTAIVAFMAGEIGAQVYHSGGWHTYYLADMTETERGFSVLISSIAYVDLPRADRIRFYLNLNGGGVAHSEAELDRVRALLAEDGVR